MTTLPTGSTAAGSDSIRSCSTPFGRETRLVSPRVHDQLVHHVFGLYSLQAKDARGERPYNPEMMTALLL